MGRLRLRLRVLHGIDEQRPAGGKGKAQKGPPCRRADLVADCVATSRSLVGLIDDWQVGQPAGPAVLACVAL